MEQPKEMGSIKTKWWTDDPWGVVSAISHAVEPFIRLLRMGGGGGRHFSISVTNSTKQPQNKNKILTWSYKPNIIYAKKLGEKIDHTRESLPSRVKLAYTIFKGLEGGQNNF